MPALANHPGKEQLGRIPTDAGLEKPLVGRKEPENAPSCCVMTTPLRSQRPGFAAATALQQVDVLLASCRDGVEGVDNVNNDASVGRKRQQVVSLPVQQREGDGAVAEAVCAEPRTMGPSL